MKVYAVVCEYYEEATGGYVSNILEGIYSTYGKAFEKVQEAEKYLAEIGVFNHVYSVKEMEVK